MPFLLALAFCATVAIQPHFLVSLPSGQSYKSPRETGEAISRLAEQGYAPLAFGHGFAGFFQYYADRRLAEFGEWASLEADLDKHDRAVILLPSGAWDMWPNRPVEARLLATNDIRFGNEIVVLERTAAKSPVTTQ